MDLVVQILPIVLTVITLLLSLVVGRFLEKLELGCIFNILVVIVCSAAPITVYVISRFICDGLL